MKLYYPALTEDQLRELIKAADETQNRLNKKEGDQVAETSARILHNAATELLIVLEDQ